MVVTYKGPKSAQCVHLHVCSTSLASIHWEMVISLSQRQSVNGLANLWQRVLKSPISLFIFYNTTTVCRGSLPIRGLPKKVLRTPSSPEHGPWTNKKSLKWWSSHAKHWAQNIITSDINSMQNCLSQFACYHNSEHVTGPCMKARLKNFCLRTYVHTTQTNLDICWHCKWPQGNHLKYVAARFARSNQWYHPRSQEISAKMCLLSVFYNVPEGSRQIYII